MPLQNYLLNECLYEGRKTTIYRARRKLHLSSVIIKTINTDHPTPEQIARLYHEYDILQSLSHVKGIVHADALEHDQNHAALILEDCGGISLKEIVGSLQVSVLAFLPIAIQLAETLHEIHQHGVVHRNINPRHLLLVPENWEVKFIDFSMALHQPSAAPIFDKRDRTQGILAYMPPEQAQKIRWSLDHRTDFYSLGVTFYELLTGQLPFTLEDRLEPIHYPPCHHPALPHQLEENIPASVSAVVMKLMAKRAKDRYQNALELKRDLETCLQQLQSSDRESS